MGADKEVLPYSYRIEGVNKIKRPEEEELVVDWRRRGRRCAEALFVSPPAAVGMPTRLVTHQKISTCWTTTSTLTACPPACPPACPLP